MADIRIVNPLGPNIATIIAFHLSGMIESSPKDSVYALNASGLSDPKVSLFGAFIDDKCLSIGALKTLNSTQGEIKSMRTIETATGQGLGKSILQHIIQFARNENLKTLLLETGTGQNFDAAHHIYKSHGFTSCGPFADYESSEFNRFFTLTL